MSPERGPSALDGSVGSGSAADSVLSAAGSANVHSGLAGARSWDTVRSGRKVVGGGAGDRSGGGVELVAGGVDRVNMTRTSQRAGDGGPVAPTVVSRWGAAVCMAGNWATATSSSAASASHVAASGAAGRCVIGIGVASGAVRSVAGTARIFRIGVRRATVLAAGSGSAGAAGRVGVRVTARSSGGRVAVVSGPRR